VGGGADSYLCQCIESLLSPYLEESAQPTHSVPLHSLSAVAVDGMPYDCQSITTLRAAAATYDQW